MIKQLADFSNDELAQIVDNGTSVVMSVARNDVHLSIEDRVPMSIAIARGELERRLGINGADAICDKYCTRGVGWAFIHRAK